MMRLGKIRFRGKMRLGEMRGQVRLGLQVR